MQTSFTPEFIQTADGERVNKILRKCVHCGFCNATCPTYQLTGNELDGPRGRIYLIKNFFEDNNADSSNETGLKHLDRCLTCLSCETTCPSGVKYGELIDIGRKHINTSIQRPILSKIKRKLILHAFSNSYRVGLLLSIARICKPFLPTTLANKIPDKIKLSSNSASEKELHTTATRKMFTIKGCVQNAAAPQINLATKKALENSDIQLDEVNAACCGALAFHLTELDRAHATIRNNIDQWYQMLNSGYEKILINSSGCSSFIKQYITIMQDDNAYSEKAKFISKRCIDLSELASELTLSTSFDRNKTIAFHSPCTLQHGSQINGKIEAKLTQAGYNLTAVKDSHLCCGSAGTYSLLETEMSSKLLKDKLTNLQEHQPDMIVTANIGCLMHIQSGTKIPVKHWIELLA
ncbi:MAG: glycolate oxidase subunit GlcF [Gammaproteobacteria bacterium]